MNNENPSVTVYMPAYNHEAYVEQAILSIVNQTYQDFELIVIDDGSSDKTSEILERLSAEYGFHFERQGNMGVPRTLNKLFRRAKGHLITGCASDDYWPLDRLELQVKSMEENPQCEFVHGAVQHVDKAGVRVERRMRQHPVDGIREFFPLLREKRVCSGTTMMVRMSLWNRVGPYDESISVEDFDWMLRAIRLCEVRYIPEVLVYYRKHGGNWTMSSAGAVKLADSSYCVATKLGLWWGVVFLFYKSPKLSSYETLAGRKRRYIFKFVSIFTRLAVKCERSICGLRSQPSHGSP